MSVLSAVKNAGKVVVSWTRAHSTQILFVGGIASLGAALYSTSKATLATEDILVDHKVNLDRAKAIGDTKEIKKLYLVTSLNVAKEFAVAAGWTALTILCFEGRYRIVNKRLVKVTAAYSALSESFKLYRQRVIDDQGNEKDIYYMTGVKPKTVKTKDPETGETVKTQVVDFGDGVTIANPYAFKFGKYRDDGELNAMWCKNQTINRATVLGQIDYLNDQLYLRSIKDNDGRIIKRGAVFLNELRDLCGQTQTTTGAVAGNRFGNGEPGCNGFISEDCIIEGTEIDPETGEEIPCLFISPNCDGMIYDLVDKFEDEPFFPTYDLSHDEETWDVDSTF